MKEEKVWIPSSGLRLEGLMSIREAFSVKGGVICCHPHPQYGGDMDNSVVATVVDAAFQEGFSTLRFNFRGVGRSEGSYGEGVGEQEDVRAAIHYLDSIRTGPNSPLILVGYSFGAWAGLPVACRDERIHAIVGIAPPVAMYDFSFLKGCKKKKLIIAGSDDPYCPTNRLKDWFEQLEEPKSFTILEGADHFFFHHHRFLIEPLKEFFRNVSSNAVFS